MSFDDDMFRHTSGRSFTNPYDPFDPSTGPLFRHSNGSDAPSGVMKGWKRAVFLGCIIAFMLMPLYLEF